MKKLIHTFERDGRMFEVVDDNGTLLCCSVKYPGAATETEDEYIGYAEDAGADMYQSRGVTWSFGITKSEVHLEDALYSRFLVETDFLRHIGAI